MGFGSGGVWMGVTFDTLARWPGQEYLCMSRIFAAYSFGGVLGPALGAFGGVRGPFFAYLALLLAALPLVLVVTAPTQGRVFAADRDVLRTRGFKLASAASLFAVLALGVFEGILPLHFAERLDQTEIAALYVAASVVVAVSAVSASKLRPVPLVVAAIVLATSGIALAGAAAHVPLWLIAVLIAAVGIGVGNTASIGVLVEAIRPERIVTAMVIWSQLGIVGYLLGPLLGGAVADEIGFAYVGLVPPGAGGAVLLAMLAGRPLRPT